MKIATSFKRIPAKNKVVLTNINYCKQKPDLLQVLLSELNILGNTSPIPTLMSFTHLAVRPPSDSALLTKVAHGGNPQDRTFALFSSRGTRPTKVLHRAAERRLSRAPIWTSPAPCSGQGREWGITIQFLALNQ